MTDSPILDPPGPAVTARGRLQRRLRDQRRRAVAHAWVAAGLTLLVVAVGTLGSRVAATPAEASDSTVDPGRREGAFTATMVGDVMFGRNVEHVIERHGQDSLLENVAPLLAGDYVSANLEQVVSDREDLPRADKLIFLRSGTEAVDILSDAGFTTVSLANNHAMDHGIPGLADTLDALEAEGIHHAGAGRDLDEAMTIDYQEHGDLTVATLSFTDAFVDGFVARAFQGGVLDADPDRFGPMIVEANANADLVIVNFHFGEEYDNGPSARQREIVELASRVGADIVIGHHAHVALPVEMVGSTLVFYGLGNFVFDQGWSRTRESVVARYALDADGQARVELVPVYIREATPRLLEGPLGGYRRARIFQRVRQGSNLDWRREGDVLVADIDHRHVVEDGSS